MIHDVAVIGAGPAGAVAARDLARSGARVALIDGSHPREKPCGGGVTGRALDLAGCDLAGGRAITSVTFEVGGRSVAVPLPDDRYLRVFPRAALDAALLRQAQDAGAELIPSRATGITRTADRWRIATAGGTVHAGWLLGADGAGGLVRKQVFRSFTRSQISIAAGAYVDDVEASEIVIAFVDQPRGYLWSFPRPGHLAVGTCAQADETTPDQMRAVTSAWLDTYGPAEARSRRTYAWPIPSLSAADLAAEQPAGDRWLLLGDAAGLVDPITREGIFFAIRSGQLAADAIGSANPGARYSRSIRLEIHGELRRAARLKAGFYRPRFTRLLVDALSVSQAIRRVMIDLVAGRQPYRGLKRRLFSTCELRLMGRLLATNLGDRAS
jgi:geranylgeranyl reductase family protein